jgi:hypothetical protein
MKRINLVNYGFVRWPEEDFSDDGNRFTCYRVGKSIRVSKHVAGGWIYLSASEPSGGNLPYQIYSQLPHYRAANWGLNGVTLDSLTYEDLHNFYEACVAYEKEYEAAEANLVYPTLEELQKKAAELYIATMANVKELEKLFNKYIFDAAVRFSPYEWKNCQEYLKSLIREMESLDPETYPQKIVNTAGSFNFMDRKHKDSYYFTYVKDLFARYCMI